MGRHAKIPESPLGKTILEALRAHGGMTQSQLAEIMGRPLKTINEIIRGKAGLTVETALQFEEVLGAPAEFWMALENRYRIELARVSK